MARILTLPSLILIVCCFVTPAEAGADDSRLSLARDMANMTLTLITDQSKNPAARIENLKRGFANVVDTNWIAKFVLGAAWRKADEKQRARYTELYHEFLMQTYISTYAQNESQQVTDIKILDVKEEAEGKFTARTEVQLSNAQKLRVDYLVKAEGEDYKVIDVTIEGVSLLSTHRNEFAQAAANVGVDGVIQKLEKLVKVN